MRKIYHYTNVDSLAMILSTRKLRFSRLDGVDDVKEAQNHAGINFGSYFFVSCWTEETQESIPQWSMYANEMRGVRLEISSYPFEDKPLIQKPGWNGVEFHPGAVSPIPFEQLWGPTYFVMPAALGRDLFAGNMDYVQDLESVYQREIEVTNTADGGRRLRGNLLCLPRYKSSTWSFQKEYRFSLLIMPSGPVPTDPKALEYYMKNHGTQMMAAFFNNIDPGIKYFDVLMAPDVFSDAAIRLGPLSSHGMKVTVEALLHKYAPTARLEDSALAGSIRTRL